VLDGHGQEMFTIEKFLASLGRKSKKIERKKND
jgi:hypothetical protein